MEWPTTWCFGGIFAWQSTIESKNCIRRVWNKRKCEVSIESNYLMYNLSSTYNSTWVRISVNKFHLYAVTHQKDRQTEWQLNFNETTRKTVHVKVLKATPCEGGQHNKIATVTSEGWSENSMTIPKLESNLIDDILCDRMEI